MAVYRPIAVFKIGLGANHSPHPPPPPPRASHNVFRNDRNQNGCRIRKKVYSLRDRPSTQGVSSSPTGTRKKQAALSPQLFSKTLSVDPTGVLNPRIPARNFKTPLLNKVSIRSSVSFARSFIYPTYLRKRCHRLRSHHCIYIQTILPC